MTCTVIRVDRYRTVHECALEPGHGGYHRTVDGLMFGEGPIRLRRVPVRAEQYLGKTAVIRELIEVVPNEEKSGLEWAACTVRLASDGPPTSLWPGQWVVLFDDGTAEILFRDDYERQYEAVAS